MRLEYIIEEMREEIVAAKMSWDIFWVFSNRRDRQKYVKTMNRDLLFFAPSIGAHYRSALITIGKIFDRDQRTMSLDSLLKSAFDQNRLTTQTKKRIESRLKRNKILIRKYMIVRGNVVAHWSGKLTREESYKKADIRFNDFQKLLHLGFSILSQIKKDVTGENLHEWNLFSSTGATRKLLEKLKSIPETKNAA
jgi:hypothetical protein